MAGAINPAENTGWTTAIIKRNYSEYMAEFVPFAQQVFTILDNGVVNSNTAPSKLNVLAFGRVSHRAEWSEGAKYPGNLRTQSATTNFWRHNARDADGQLHKTEPKLVSYEDLEFEGEETKVLQSKNMCFAPREGTLINGGFPFRTHAY